MLLDKIARLLGPTPTLDTPVDIAGYAALISQTRSFVEAPTITAAEMKESLRRAFTEDND